MHTMGDVARMSITNQEFLYELFGVNAELLIDHAWGYEPATIKSAKSYVPTTNSISSGQVLSTPYNFKQARLIISEMTDLLVLDLVRKNLVTSQLTLTIGYDVSNLTNPNIRKNYRGEIKMDHYGRFVPKHSHGTINLDYKTSSTKLIMEAMLKLYDRITEGNLLIRRLNICACDVEDATSYAKKDKHVLEQVNLFTDYDELVNNRKKTKEQ